MLMIGMRRGVSGLARHLANTAILEAPSPWPRSWQKGIAMAQREPSPNPPRPTSGKDSAPGWAAFVSAPRLLSFGIPSIPRRDKRGDIGVTHSFLVSGPDECVEANFP